MSINRVASALEEQQRQKDRERWQAERAAVRAARAAWVEPRFGTGGRLLNASEIPEAQRAKVAVSMGKTVEEVFGSLINGTQTPTAPSPASAPVATYQQKVNASAQRATIKHPQLADPAVRAGLLDYIRQCKEMPENREVFATNDTWPEQIADRYFAIQKKKPINFPGNETADKSAP